jgi:hypothetical protein
LGGGEQQRRAEGKGLSDDERAGRQSETWEAIQEVPSVEDMMRDTDAPPRPPEPSWAAYLEAEGEALVLITEASLGGLKRTHRETSRRRPR